jgi:hypothetical protein
MRVMLASEMAHSSALRGFQKAMRAGDLALADKWLRLAERHYRLVEAARRDADDWKQFKRRCAATDAEKQRRIEENRKWARQLRAAEHQKRLKAIEGG